MGISADRYKQVWSAMSCTAVRRKRVDVTTGGGGWTHRPKKGNALISELEQDAAAINRQLLYIPKATVLSLDDDHLRLSSRAVALLTNLRQINNPQKALGPVMNALCSALTSCYISGHYTRNGEQLIDVWVRVVQLLQGATSKNALSPMTDAIFAADRGYNHAASIAFLTDVLGASAIGTHKRSLDFPFMFGDSSLPHKHKGYHISEKGCRALYSSKQKQSGSCRTRRVEAAVYRESCTGRIAASYHNNERLFGSNNFTLVPCDRFRGVVDSSKLNAVQTCYECQECAMLPLPPQVWPGAAAARQKCERLYSELTHMTFFQSEDPCWFLMRAFLFTSRTGHGFLRAVGRNFESYVRGISALLEGRTIFPELTVSLVEDVAYSFVKDMFDGIFQWLGIQKMSIDEPDSAVEIRDQIMSITEESLRRMRKAEITSFLSKSGRGHVPFQGCSHQVH